MDMKWLNVFRFCKFLKAVGYMMVVLVMTLLGFSYYSVVVLTLVPAIKSTHELWLQQVYIALAVIFSILILMIVWSYFATLIQDPGRVPVGWHPFGDEETAQRELDRWLMYGDRVHNRADPRRPRYCMKCENWKPERTHHCSVSGRCILRMDHYCIWVVNCVGMLNYKFFFLFLAYTWLGCLLAVSILAPGLVRMFPENAQKGELVVFMACILDSVFVVSLLGFLFMHVKLLSVNCTSIEMYEKQRVHPWPYDMGWRQNMEEVFGKNKWLWLLPVYTKEEKERLMELVLCPRLIDPEAQQQ